VRSGYGNPETAEAQGRSFALEMGSFLVSYPVHLRRRKTAAICVSYFCEQFLTTGVKWKTGKSRSGGDRCGGDLALRTHLFAGLELRSSSRKESSA
jgi:hypothetical protein